MNKKILLAEILLAFLLVLGFRYRNSDESPLPKLVNRQQAYQSRLVIHCSPDWSQINADSLAAGISPLPGIGNYQWKINSPSDSAAFYFNQGINLYYAFHIIESMASFKKAEKFDDSNAMIYWGEALAYGPNINDFQYAAAPDAFAAAQKALSLSANNSKREKALIKAMAVRYSLDSTGSQSSLNKLYTSKMQAAYKEFSADNDVAVLYADAMMIEHPWDYWKHDGAAQPWTPAIITVLEKELKQSPNHPGANHYYIHMVEASPNPGRAMASANRLGSLMPGVSHVVHMPSHIYIRTGNYSQGTAVNEEAVKGYQRYLALYPDVANNSPLYLIHNIHMQTANAMMMGNYAYSIRSAVDAQKSFDSSFNSFPAPMGNFVQYVYMSPVFVMVRYGKWKDILDHPAVPDNYVYANAIWHWARGLAFADAGNMPAAKKELGLLREKMKHPDMAVVFTPFNSPLSAAKVAENILMGRLAEKNHDLKNAVRYFETAVKDEDSLIYNEPRDWLLPAREYLGNVLLNTNPAQAEKIFREDLQQSPNNIWSAFGLYQSLQKQRKYAESEQKIKFGKLMTGSDTELKSPVF